MILRRQQKGLLDKLQDLNTTGGSTDIESDPNDVTLMAYFVFRRYFSLVMI